MTGVDGDKVPDRILDIHFLYWVSLEQCNKQIRAVDIWPFCITVSWLPGTVAHSLAHCTHMRTVAKRSNQKRIGITATLLLFRLNYQYLYNTNWSRMPIYSDLP